MAVSVHLLGSLLAAATASGAPEATANSDQEIVELRSMVETLRGEVDQLRAESDDSWLTQQRSEQIRSLVTDVLADADTRASLQGDGSTSGYSGGFYIRSADNAFAMKINGQIQARYMYNDAKEQAADYGFEVRRLKLKFHGHVIDESWTYSLAVINQRDSQGNASAGFYAEDAWIQKKFDSGVYVKAGQFKAPMLREELVSSSAQLTVERSMLNNQFTYGWTQGVEVGNQDESFWWRAMFNDGPNAANQQSQGEDDTLSIVARADFRLAGDWKNWKSFTGRSVPTETYAFIGAAFQWFNNSHRGYEANGDAYNHTEFGGYLGLRSYGLTVDGSVGGDNWTAYAAFMWADNGSTVTNTGAMVDGNQAWGVLAQIGLMLDDDLQVFGRYEHGRVSDYDGGVVPPAQGGHGRVNALTVGANVWLSSGRTIKWTTDLGYSFSTLNNGGASGPPVPPGPSVDYVSSGNGWRSDVDDNTGQWLVRTQLQLIF